MYIRYLTLFITLLLCSTGFALDDKAEPTTGFNLIGYIQNFKLIDSNDPLSRAEMTVNGITVIIPKNLKIVMPGTYLTANDIFRGKKGTSSTPATDTSCIALDDREKSVCAKQPEFPYTAEIVGNIVGKDFIAGLVNIGQIPLQTSSGFVKKICFQVDAASGCLRAGELLIGPTDNNPAVSAHLRLNDPLGRFGPISAADQDDRFKADLDNPTIHTATGYPLCIPRSTNDPLCPSSNRQGLRFTIGSKQATNIKDIPVAGANLCGSTCDAHKMVPLAEGDFVSYIGTLQRDNQGFYVSASALEADIGAYTTPKIDPAYVAIEEAIIGTGGTAFAGIDQETGPGKVVPGQNIITRFRIVGFTTDPSRNVDIFALDANGDCRHLISVAPEEIAPIGRFRITLDGQIFTPTTREIRAQIAGIWKFDKLKKTCEERVSSEPEKSANGLIFGRYDAPVGEYIFPEGRVLGGKTPEPGLIPANFEDLCFLSQGTGQLDTLGREPGPGTSFPMVGKLDPWPDSEKLPFQTIPSKSAHQPPGIFCQ